ncbi:MULTISPECIES: hypothetical protein [Sphingomonadaceae]|jgi:hypothetical protein|uniref:Uncharacterized protein n=2 Tax=Sphingomonadaceae TaxID=41297 RepID=A0A841J7D4_9SPHN|nr:MULTISPECIES: hypothetical protein [Sphingomonadaceae]MBB6125436.1 hypothetical protein [Sphingobium subterraneum]MDE8653404.1 hypothetical protein [Novosphingobium album (ex Liu et al. 2023)]
MSGTLPIIGITNARSANVDDQQASDGDDHDGHQKPFHGDMVC